MSLNFFEIFFFEHLALGIGGLYIWVIIHANLNYHDTI